MCNACLISKLPFANTQADEHDVLSTNAGGVVDTQADEHDLLSTDAGCGVDTQAEEHDVLSRDAGGGVDTQADEHDLLSPDAGGGVDTQADEHDVLSPDAGGGVDTQADVDVSLDSSDDIYKVFCRKGLHFLHLNIRSLPPSIDEIRTIAIQTKPAVIALTETWLHDSVNYSELRINNYCLIRADRSRQRGGVCLFIRENLTFNRILDIITDSIETLWVEILQPKAVPIIVGVAYRPPTQSDFYDKFEQTCHQIDSNKHEIIILGDFNTDVKGDSNLQRRLVEFQTTFDLDQLIVEPTRITPTIRTIIDLILVSDPAKISHSCVIEIGVSDHFVNILYS